MKNQMTDLTGVREKSIQDFGEQWVRYQDNAGFYGSSELFTDMLAGLMDPSEIKGLDVLDVGSGTGRIVLMLLAAGAGHVHAVEPSQAIEVLRNNVRDVAGRVTCHAVAGDEIPDLPVDAAFSIGVLHHIPQPEAVVARVFQVLRPGGKFLFWVYGEEGNRLYLSLILPLRRLTARLPDPVLRAICHALNVLLGVYIFACRFLPLPLRGYLNQVLRHFSWHKRFLVIFDQLNPIYARYYTGTEAEQLMGSAGFTQIRKQHRHGYSWTVIGVKPESKSIP